MSYSSHILGYLYIRWKMTPTSIGTPLKKSLFYTKWYKIKYTYVFYATVYCM